LRKTFRTSSAAALG